MFQAEEIERNKVLKEESKEKQLESQIELDEKVSKIIKSDNVVRIAKENSLEFFKLNGRVGTFNGKYAIKGFKNKIPKAISVKKICIDSSKGIMSRIDLYKVYEKQGNILEKTEKEGKVEEVFSMTLVQLKEMLRL